MLGTQSFGNLIGYSTYFGKLVRLTIDVLECAISKIDGLDLASCRHQKPWLNQGTITSDSRFGILSKSGADAKKMFTDKVVPISTNYPFFFKPIQDGMDKPKTELAYQVPASKLTKRSIQDTETDEDLSGLDTTIDWKNTGDNSYDGEKLQLLFMTKVENGKDPIISSTAGESLKLVFDWEEGLLASV